LWPILAHDTISSTCASVFCGIQDPRREEKKRCARLKDRPLKTSWKKDWVISPAQKHCKGRDDPSAKSLTLRPNGEQTWWLFVLALNTVVDTQLALNRSDMLRASFSTTPLAQCFWFGRSHEKNFPSRDEVAWEKSLTSIAVTLRLAFDHRRRKNFSQLAASLLRSSLPPL
jgi:hypothetical protein